MYILHQKKLGIIEFKDVWINKYHEKFYIEINNCSMGSYSTEEKAKIVVLEIFKNLKEGGCYYEMPLDSEVIVND